MKYLFTLALTTAATFAASVNNPNCVVPTPTPEPATVGLIGIGLVGFVVYGWRRSRNNK